MTIGQLLSRIYSAGNHRALSFISRFMPEKGAVLMLHSVGGNPDYEFNIPTEKFEKLLTALSNENIIHLGDWEKAADFFALSADDVPQDFYVNAFPLLKKHGIPFTIFVATSLLDTDGYITTEQLKEMAASPLCTVGSHGVNHSFFRSLNKDERHDELAGSKRTLEKIIGKPVELYAFPYGSYYACGYHNKKQVLDNYKYGFGTVNAYITHPRLLKKYFLPRINVNSALIDKLTSSN